MAVATVRARRRAQLGLTLLAVVVSGSAYVLAALGKSGRVPEGVGTFVGIVAGSYLAAHLLVSRLAPGADPVFLPTAAVLAGLGYAMIFRLDPDLAAAQFGWLMVGLGLFALTLVLVRDQRRLDAYTYTIGLLGVAFLLLPTLPGVGRTVNGARLWVRFGPLSFQPAEVAKVLVVVFLASYLGARKELLAVATRRLGPLHLPEPRHLGPVFVAWGLSLAVLFVERDLGSSLLFFGIFVVMLWTATGRAAYLLLGLVLFAAGAAVGWAAFDHVETRVDIWLHALDPDRVDDFGYGQLAQSQFAMATGGLAGTGLGRGNPDLIPFATTDFIFAAIGEELGLFGTTALLLLYVVLVARGFRAALAATDPFSKLLAAGLTTVLGLQTFIIVGGVTRLIPLTGITLPFVSYGGSSLVANFVLLALLVRTSAPPRPGATAGGRP
ncbi:MAG TPA: FtsW/RodA/SpoVE family cell cycle protein [Actinomycetota bacterium]|nr:FtsW/RodA/SpoVE family cell cycle protein [Actinomycetota bacterium]